MTLHLLGASVLIPLCIADHEHHEGALRWFGSAGEVALCPIAEGALLRTLLRVGESSATARTVLERVRAHPRTRFVPDALSYTEVDLGEVRGHRQVTDHYLVALARHGGAKLATFDAALAARFPEECDLLQA